MHDSAYKLLFSYPQMVEDLLQSYVGGDWIKELDFSTLEKLPTSFVSDDLRQRHEDLIWRVQFRGSWLYVLLMLEFQSSVETYMAVRLQSYTGLLYQDIIRTKALGPQGQLPPVLPMVIYNGEPRWTATVELNELITPVNEPLAAFQPHQRYWLLDVGRHHTSALPRERNLVAALIQLENSRTPADLPPVLEALIRWLGSSEESGLKRAFSEWIVRVLLPSRLPGVELPPLQQLDEVKTMLAERVKEWTEQWRQEGLQKGLEQGLEQGIEQGLEQERRLLQRQAAHKFDMDTAQQLATLLSSLRDPEQLAQIGEWIIDCSSGSELLARVRSLVS